MAGLQSLMQRGNMPGQAGMFSALPTQQGRNPVAFTTSLKQIPPEDLIRIYNDPNDTRPKWAVASAYADAMKAKALQQGMQGQQAMAQNVAAQQKPPIADEVMATFKHGGAIGFADAGSTDAFTVLQRLAQQVQDAEKASVEADKVLQSQTDPEGYRAAKKAATEAQTRLDEARKAFRLGPPMTAGVPPIQRLTSILSPESTPTKEVQQAAVAPAQGRVRKDETAILTEKADRASSAPAVTAPPSAPPPSAGLGALAGDMTPYERRLETATQLAEAAARERGKVTPEMLAARERVEQARARQLQQSEEDIRKVREEGVGQLQRRLDAARRPISEDPEALLALAAAINPKRGKVIGSLAEGGAKALAERRGRAEKAEEGITALSEKMRQLNAQYQEAQALEEQRKYAMLTNDIEGQRNAEIEATKLQMEMRKTQAAIRATLEEASAKRQAAVTGAYHARTADEANRLAAMGRVESNKQEELRKIEAEHKKDNANIYQYEQLPSQSEHIKQKLREKNEELQKKLDAASQAYEQVLAPMRAGIPGLAGLSAIQRGQWGQLRVEPSK